MENSSSASQSQSNLQQQPLPLVTDMENRGKIKIGFEILYPTAKHFPRESLKIASPPTVAKLFR